MENIKKGLVRRASELDIASISDIALQTWWPTYTNIISAEQIKFMLEQMYSEKAILAQMLSGQVFLLIEEENVPLGFVSYDCIDATESCWKIHKLYLLPQQQGKGIGRQLVDAARENMVSKGAKTILLNVNRNNPAFHFYLKYGFVIDETIDIPYHGFMLNDYVLRFALK